MTVQDEKVRDWMSPDVVTVGPDTSLHDAHRLMQTHQIRHLPVLQDQKLVGWVTAGDVRRAEPSNVTSLSVWEVNYLVSKVKVKDFMTASVISIPEAASIGDAAQKLMLHRISGLPVVSDAGKLVGIITETDIFRLIVSQEWQLLQLTESKT